jgi:deoxyribodipyrimidine photo-lyase
MFFTPTSNAARDRATAFLPKMGRAYAAQRNFDFGPHSEQDARRDNVSVLSPWLRHRLISEEQLLAMALDRHGAANAEKYISEVLWRAYFKGWLELRPGVWHDYCADRDAAIALLNGNSGLRHAYDAAISGNTGIDAFDAFAQELVETNYLHNHARMWFASIWIFTLKLPWVLGADFFLQHLIDGDAASNTCSWRWVGGLHTIGKTYLARPDNIAQYTEGRFAPQGLAAQAPPLADMRTYPAGKAPVGDATPQSPYALLIHAEDCLPETLPLSRPPQAVILLDVPDPRSPQAVAQAVTDFAKGALADSGQRAAAHWGCPVQRWSAADGPLANAIKSAGVAQAAMAWLPTGSLRDALLPHLEGLSIAHILRDYDADTWPHATKGFFHLRQKSEPVLRRLGSPDLLSGLS